MHVQLILPNAERKHRNVKPSEKMSTRKNKSYGEAGLTSGPIRLKKYAKSGSRNVPNKAKRAMREVEKRKNQSD